MARFRTGDGRARVDVLPVIAGLAGTPGLAAFVCIAGAMAAGIAALESELVAEELALERWWAVTLAAPGAVLAVLSMAPWPYVVERLYTGEAGPPPTALPGADAWPDERLGRSAG